MANLSDTDKLTSGESRKQAGSPVSKRKSGRLPERDELPESDLDKVTGGVMDDPCAGGQYRRVALDDSHGHPLPGCRLARHPRVNGASVRPLAACRLRAGSHELRNGVL